MSTFSCSTPLGGPYYTVVCFVPDFICGKMILRSVIQRDYASERKLYDFLLLKICVIGYNNKNGKTSYNNIIILIVVENYFEMWFSISCQLFLIYQA